MTPEAIKEIIQKFPLRDVIEIAFAACCIVHDAAKVEASKEFAQALRNLADEIEP